jgi:mannose-6-phosphate isomerase-like protein (cupin superfamily)
MRPQGDQGDLEWEHRPWGAWSAVYSSPETTVKLILVEPGECLSLQWHKMRDEIWAVVRGNPTIIIGDEQWTGHPGRVYAAPRNVAHRIANEGNEPVEIVEIIHGKWDEGDITRIDDKYAR